MPKVLVSTVPFGSDTKLPLEMLEAAGIDYEINKYDRKLTKEEMEEYLAEFDGLIAGTEIISELAIRNAKRLKIISRVGIGLDGVDLLAARANDVKVTYTPDAPAPAVAELTIGLILGLIRNIHVSNHELHSKGWFRHFGHRVPDLTFGIIGAGRIGERVLRRLSAFGTPRFLVNDSEHKPHLDREFKIEWVSKDKLLAESDVVTIHVPLTKNSKGMIGLNELKKMKESAYLINTARGGIVQEDALYEALSNNVIKGAAVDVFEQEPYSGPLCDLENVILTAHMGSMSRDCRNRMEIEATQEIINFFNGEKLNQPVPTQEYALRED
ncbi:phosphoglycerate dehydrogenase [Catenovulum agarivorans]|uniref:phosphoglycerate dehydrogenase n=1 Tax=Catenovulum agarivorans TaxID=1172192 RepID=UPI0002D42E84|nr:phosphoglycerate dehydrogenase [Catenovulum agarivorans]